MEKWEQNTVINELLQGLELTKQLQLHLSSSSPPETRELLARGIVDSFEKALMILNWNGATGQTQIVEATANVVESPLSINGSPWSENLDEGHREHRDVTKKRKLMPTWTDQVKINFENGFEGPHEDGYSWRKYGQKDILGAKYPRSYYRCTFRNSKNCWASKQVQRSEDDPSVFHITYRGKHTCNHHHNQSIPAPTSPEKQENHQTNQQQLNQSQEVLFNFRANLRVNTDSDNIETSSPFPFPSTSFGSMSSNLLGGSETNYFSLPLCHMQYFGGDQNLGFSASDLTGTISTNTSATNSPIVNLDFSLDPVEIDPYFPFGSPGFFS